MPRIGKSIGKIDDLTLRMVSTSVGSLSRMVLWHRK